MQDRQRKFPLVADDEVVIDSPKVMELYDNEDLINNIHGFYQDKTYHDMPDLSQGSTKVSLSQADVAIIQEEKSYAEVARETAKADVKKKRQALLKQESQSKVVRPHMVTASPLTISDQLLDREEIDLISSQVPKLDRRKAIRSEGSKPSKELKSLHGKTSLSKYSDKLRQETYILAEIQEMYQMPENTAPKPKKNSYDFLKKSQIYNHAERQSQREYQIAQELNLTRFDD